MTDKKTSNINVLQTVALTIVVIGAAGSLFFMFNAGRNQKSILLMALFTAWVLSPFFGLFILNKILSRWTVAPARALVLWLMIILTMGSVVAYSGVLLPPETKTAFIILVAPLAAWILIVIIFLLSRKIFKQKQRT
jgi:hypothetical protein